MSWRPTAIVCCVLLMATGCSQKPGPPVAQTPPQSVNPIVQPPPQVVANEPTAAAPAGGEFGQSGWRPPVASMAGGGGTPAPQSAGGAVNIPSGTATPLGLSNGLYPVMNSNAASNVAGSLKNGLYPQIASQPVASNATGQNRPTPGFGGGEPGVPSGGQPNTNTTVGGRNTPGGNRPGLPVDPNSAAPQPSNVVVGDGEMKSAAVEPGEEFLVKAKDLFADGEENDAVRHLYAYLLAKEDAFGEYPLQWFPGLAQPRAFLRLGIGVEYQPLKDFEGKPPVIGDPVAEAGGRRNAGGGGGGADDTIGNNSTNSGAGSSGSPYANANTETPAGFLLYYTGDYIERLYRELNDRRKRDPGFFGKLLVAIPDRMPTGPASTAVAAPPVSSSPSSEGRNLPTAAAGGGAPTGGDSGGNSGNATGGGGNANNPGSRNVTRKLIDVWAGSAAANAPERLVIGTLIPGIMCLGEGKAADLVKRGKSYGLDAVLVLDVNIGKARGSNYSSTSLRLYLVNAEDPDKHVATNKSLKNTTVMEARRGSAGGGESDLLVIELNRVLKDYIDANLKSSSLPESLTAENVASRVERVVNGTYHDPLQVAVEVVGFYRMGLLQEDKTIAALNKLFGEGGDVILSGSDSEKADLLKSQLSKSLSGL